MKTDIRQLVDRHAPLGVFFVVLVYLLYCAVPSLYWGDSAEMVAVSCDMGVAHSPGYPLFTIVSRIFSWLPLSPYPFRLNIMSAFLIALSASMIFSAARKMAGGSVLAGLSVIAGLMGCREFTKYGLYAEVYPLHMFLFSAILLIVASYREKGGVGAMLVALFLAGVGLAHHMMMLFVLAALLFYLMLLPGHRWRVAAGPPVILLGWVMVLMFRAHATAAKMINVVAIMLVVLTVVYIGYIVALVLMKKLQRSTPGLTIATLLLIFGGLLIFGYMPLASARAPMSDWWAPDTAVNFFKLLLLQGYESTFPQTGAILLQRLNVLGLLLQVPILMLLVAIPGLVFAFRKRPRAAAFVTVLIIGSLAGSLVVQHGKPEALRLPVYVLLYLLAGIGAYAIFTWKKFEGGLIRVGLKWFFTVVVVAIFVLNLGDGNWTYMNRNMGAYEFGRSIIEGPRAGSVVFIGSQTPSIIGYFDSCEPEVLENRDLKIIPVAFLPFEWKLEQLRKKYRGIAFPPAPPEWAERPIFRLDDPARASYAEDLLDLNNIVDGVYSDFLFLTEDNNRMTIPNGVLYQVLPGNVSSDRAKEMIAKDVPPQWNEESMRDVVSAANFASVYNERGKIYLDYGIRGIDEEMVRKSLVEFNLALDTTDIALDGYARALRIEKVTLDTVASTFGIDLSSEKQTQDPEFADLFNDIDQLAIDKQQQQQQQYDDNVEEEEAAAWRIFYAQVSELLNVRAEAMLNKGQCRMYYGQMNEGISLMKKSLQMAPFNSRLYEALATVYFRQQTGTSVVRAIALWRMVTVLDPGNARAYHNLGSAMVALQQKEQGLAYYQRALDIDPLYKSAYVNIARLYNQLDNCAQAVLHLEKAKQYFPDDIEVRSELAQQYGDCGMMHLYSQEVEEIIARFPNDQKLYYTLAIIFRNGGQAGNMAKAIKEMLKIDPEFPVRRFFATMEECDEAIWLLEQLTKELPDLIDLQLELSLRYGLCGDEQMAIEVMEKIVKENPDNDAAKALLERFKAPVSEEDEMLEGNIQEAPRQDYYEGGSSGSNPFLEGGGGTNPK